MIKTVLMVFFASHNKSTDFAQQQQNRIQRFPFPWFQYQHKNGLAYNDGISVTEKYMKLYVSFESELKRWYETWWSTVDCTRNIIPFRNSWQWWVSVA